MIYLRQSTASQEIPLGHFVDDTDGKTAETGLTIANTDIKVWKTGATTLADKNSGGATHISGGIYYAVLDATDTDTIGPLVIFVAVSGALAVRLECCVLDEAVYDVKFGTTAPATATNITAGTITTTTNVTNNVNAVLANTAHGGTSATLRLGTSGTDPAFWVSSSGGPAARIQSTHNNSASFGLEISVHASGGANAISAISVAGNALSLSSGVAGLYASSIVADANGIVWNSDWDAEVQSEVADALTAYGVATSANVSAVETDTQDIQSRLPAALVSGRIDASVGAMASDTLTAAALAADAVTEIQSGLSTLTSAQVNTEIDNALADINLDHLVKIAVDTDFDTTVHTNSVVGQLAHNGIGTGGGYDRTTDSLEALRDRGDAAWVTATGFSTHSASDVWAVGTRTITSLDEDTTTLDLDTTIRAAVGLASANLDTQLADIPTVSELATEINSVQSNIAALNNLSAAQVNAEVDTALSDIYLDKLLRNAVSSFETNVHLDSVIGYITSNGVGTGTVNGYNRTTDSLEALVDSIWDETLSGHLSSGSTGEALNGAGSAGDPWSTALPGAYGAGSAGFIVGTNLNATVSSRLASASYTAPLDAAGTRTALGLASANLDTQLADIPTVAELTSEINSVQSDIAALNNISTAQVNSEVDTALADVGLTTTITGRIDVAVSTRLASASYTAPLDASGVRTAIGLASANLDTQLTGINTNVDAVDTSVATKPTLAQILAGGDIDGKTIEETLKVMASALMGKLSGAGTTTISIRAIDDSKVRITATVDADGNRSAVTLDTAG